MRIMTLLLLFVIATSVHAEVYKCYTPSKKVSYQPTPCSAGSGNQNVIEIQKQSPQQIEEAQRQLNAVETERMQRDAAAKLQREAAAEKWNADATQRDAAAARQEAAAARREAEAARQDAQAARQQAENPVMITYPRYNDYDNPYRHNYRNNPNPVVVPLNVPPSKSVSPYQPQK